MGEGETTDRLGSNSSGAVTCLCYRRTGLNRSFQTTKDTKHVITAGGQAWLIKLRSPEDDFHEHALSLIKQIQFKNSCHRSRKLHVKI